MLNKIEQWIDQINIDHERQRVSCSRFADTFSGFYPLWFLEQAYFVVVNKIPKPDFTGLNEIGLKGFIDMDVDGITYKNTYYILCHKESELRLHFHELVHVAQWARLGSANFIKRYVEEIQTYSYKKAPLEEMAYRLEADFTNSASKIDVPSYVSENL